MFTCTRCGKKELGKELTIKGRRGEVELPKKWQMRFENLSNGGTIGNAVCPTCISKDV